ncbi:sensor histidine kinase [Flavobacterium sp.]|jgi:two-component system NarL family sensor kinase|uniref:sensor histidine kinase n=1 Tax=Flavobacterium sp. TaxID=239 RepID=UPI0037BE94CF
MKLLYYLLLLTPLINYGGNEPNQLKKRIKSIDSLIFIGDFISAEKLVNTTTLEESETRDSKLLLNRKAVLYYKQKKIIESFSILKSNLAYFKKVNDKSEQCNILILIGNLYYEFNHIELAEYYYLESEKLAKKDDSKEIVYFNLVNIYTDKKDEKKYTHYIALLDELYAKDQKNNNLLLKIKIYKLLYLNSVNKSRSNEFKKELTDIDALIKMSNNDFLKLYYKMLLSVHESNNGNNEESVRLIDSVINEFDKLYFDFDKIIAMQIKSEIVTKTGNFKKGFLILKQLNSINEKRSSLITKDIINDFNNFIDKINKENEVLELKNKISRKNSILYLIVFIILIVLLSILYLNKYRRKQKEVDLKNNVVTNLKLIIEAEEKERNRIATEIHDGLGGLLSAAKMQISSNNNPKIEELIDKIIVESKSISNNLTTELLSRKNLIEVVNDYIVLLNQNCINIKFQTVNFEQIENKNLNINIYRIIQELLTNVIKHAKSSEVLLQLSKFENKVQISIEDNGIGFDYNSTKLNSGVGLSNIKQRINLYNGNIVIDSKLNLGTSIYIELKIENEN